MVLRGASVVVAALAILLAAPLSFAQSDVPCPKCAEWNAPQEPFRIFGNTYYVGTRGISSILITSPQGHVLIDGCLYAAPQIAEHIRKLGFRMEDVKWIVNSHVHYDHSGSLAELQRLSGAQVAASPWSAAVLTKTGIGKGDPQYTGMTPTPLVRGAHVLKDGETLKVGTLTLIAHFTPGHTPGGTSWTWRSCEGDHCVSMVYADSMTSVSSDDYRYSDHPDEVQGFRKSFAFLRSVPCDVLLTPHPEFSGLWTRLQRREAGEANAMVEPQACKTLADQSDQQLQKRLASEKESAAPTSQAPKL